MHLNVWTRGPDVLVIYRNIWLIYLALKDSDQLNAHANSFGEYYNTLGESHADLKIK